MTAKAKTGVKLKIIITPNENNPMTLQDVLDFIGKIEKASQSEPEKAAPKESEKVRKSSVPH